MHNNMFVGEPRAIIHTARNLNSVARAGVDL